MLYIRGRHCFAAAALVAAGALSVGCDKSGGAPRISETSTTGATVPRTWQEITNDWPDTPKKAAKEMTDKYGPPDEMTATQLVWNQRGPWKRSILQKQETHHEWPTPHEDVLEQVIDYRVPAEKVGELARFDGSVIVERTKGELSARCAGEAANFLALNLAREIVEGTKNVESARHVYEQSMKQHKSGDRGQPIMTGLQFSPTPNVGDRDQTVH